MSSRRGGAILAGALVGVVAIAALANALPRGLSRAQVDEILTARYGPLGAGVSWGDVAYRHVAQELGLDNMPGEAAARRLQALVGGVLGPVQVYRGGQVLVTDGFRTPIVTRQVGSAACTLPGHEDGTALDVRFAGVSDVETARAIRGFGVPVSRLVICGGHVHLEQCPGQPRPAVLVRLPSGELVPARGV